MNRTLVFDLDGTLVDSAPDIHASLVRVLVADGRRGVDLDEVRRMVGDGVEMLIERALVATGGVRADDGVDAVLGRYRADYRQHLTDLTRPFPGVPEGLARLADAGWRLAVCTNKPEAPARVILERLGLLAFFGAVIGGDTLPTRKPDAAPLLAAIDRVGGDVGASILVGDGLHDLLAARAAQAGFIGVSWGYQPEQMRAEDPALHLIDRFDALPQMAASLRPAT